MDAIFAALLGGILMLGAIWVRTRLWTFRAQTPEDYAGGPSFDISERLRGPLLCEGVIYGPSGRVTSRFVARMDVRWRDGPGGRTGVMSEAFRYDSGRVQHREWRLELRPDGAIEAAADDLIGIGTGRQEGSAVRLDYRIRLPKEAGGHVLDVIDWMYLMENGSIMNRSQFRMLGVTVAELIATMRPIGIAAEGDPLREAA